MPSTYTHYRMGQQVRTQVTEKARNTIDRNRQLYDIGLHGPDILFYYKPLSDNNVHRIGYRIHEESGYDFFARAAAVLCSIPTEKREPYLAYLYGVLVHFALDATCHGYIDEKMMRSGISHAEIEAEWDRKLMVMDGYNPVAHRLTDHIHSTMENAGVIQTFFPDADAEQVKKAMNGMIRCHNLLLAPKKCKRKLIDFVLKLSGNYDAMHGLMISYEENPACADSTKRLLELYPVAMQRAIDFIDGFEKYFVEQSDSNVLFQYSFNSERLPRKDDSRPLCS